MSSGCPSAEQLRDLAAGRLPPAEADLVVKHVETCATCMALLQSESLPDAAGSALAPAAQPLDSPEPEVVDALIARVKRSAGRAAHSQHTIGLPVPASNDRATAALAGSVIAGRYTLVEPVGEGGMGEVWVATQTEPVKRRVAIKVIKAGMDSKAVLQRFEAERQALALMDHPNIARVFDGGMTDERRPFFVMELIDGLPLNRFCDERKLDVRGRLELFTTVCQAVQHAHQKGIIHRDLKPTNILVTLIDGRPVPKIIDFGVAKAVGGGLTIDTMATQLGAVVGTLEYMSPEQAGLSTADVDTRADIYSLGVILYELLTGLRPIDSARLQKAAVAEMVRIIQEEEPSKPSTRLSTHEAAPSLAALRLTEPKRLTALLRGELDWVVMKCLEKQRERRYETANGLARDIQRYLAHEPVEARPPSAAYRMSKFVRRNKASVAAALLILASMVAGIVGTSWQAYRANQYARAEHAANEQTQKRLAQIEKGVDLFAGMLRDINPQSEQKGGPNVYELLRERAEKAAELLDAESVGDPLAVARLQLLLGSTLRSLGSWMKTVAVLEAADATRTRELGPDHPDTLSCRHELAHAYKDSGQLARSLPLFEATLNARERALGSDHPDTLRSRYSLGRAYMHSGDNDRALLLFESTLKDQEATLGPNHPDTVGTRSSLAAIYNASGRADKALPLIEATYHARAATLGPDHLDTLSSRHNLAIAFHLAGQLDRAFPIYEATVKALEAKVGIDHPNTMLARNNLAMAYNAANRIDDSIALFLATLKASEAKLGFNHTNTLMTRFNLGSAYVDAGRLAEAFALLEQAATVMVDRQFQHDFAGGLMRTIIMAYERAGQVEKAEAWRKKWLAHLREKLGATSSAFADELDVEAGNSLREKNWTGAESLMRDCLAIRERLEPDTWSRFDAQSRLGAALLGQQKYADAEPLLLQGHSGLKQRESVMPKNRSANIAAALDRLIELYAVTSRTDEVQKWQAERAKYPPKP